MGDIALVQFRDKQIQTLYSLAQDTDMSLISSDQRVAIDLLGTLAREGNEEAMKAILSLLRLPELHPLLKEMVAAHAGVSARAGS